MEPDLPSCAEPQALTQNVVQLTERTQRMTVGQAKLSSSLIMHGSCILSRTPLNHCKVVWNTRVNIDHVFQVYSLASHLEVEYGTGWHVADSTCDELWGAFVRLRDSRRLSTGCVLVLFAAGPV